MTALLEYVPLIAFFIAYSKWGIITATIALVTVSIIILPIVYILTKKIPKMQIITVAVVSIFGGLTIFFNDPIFIKMKPTIIQAIFGIILITCNFIEKYPLKTIMKTIKMENEKWKILTTRFALFFFFMAALNEYVWRSYSENFWVNFKVFGLTVFTFIFIISQLSFLKKNSSGL